jgi:hypothetical protein
MKKYLLLCVSAFLLAAQGFAEGPFEAQSPLVLDFPNVLKLVRENLNGWTKLSFDGGHALWMPRFFYTEKASDPQKWISQIRELGFCQPDKLWKSFPVLSISDSLSSGFEQVALNPKSTLTTQMMYSETVIVGGKARNVSYDYRQNGPQVNVTCSAANETGDVQSIEQSFNIRDPKTFGVQQKKNGKLLEI